MWKVFLFTQKHQSPGPPVPHVRFKYTSAQLCQATDCTPRWVWAGQGSAEFVWIPLNIFRCRAPGHVTAAITCSKYCSCIILDPCRGWRGVWDGNLTPTEFSFCAMTIRPDIWGERREGKVQVLRRQLACRVGPRIIIRHSRWSLLLFRSLPGVVVLLFMSTQLTTGAGRNVARVRYLYLE